MGGYIIVADNVFFSVDNFKKLNNWHLIHIIPLRKNSLFVLEYGDFYGVFMYDGKVMTK